MSPSRCNFLRNINLFVLLKRNMIWIQNSICIDHKYCKALDVKSPFVNRKNKTDKKGANISKNASNSILDHKYPTASSF